MARLAERLAIAKRALKVLDEILKEPITDIVRDAAIQRFEFTFEAVWKFAQLYLREKEGVVLGSPKSVFRACLDAGIFDATETELALNMVDDRNLTSHTYNEKLSQQIFKKLASHYKLMSRLIVQAEAKI